MLTLLLLEIETNFVNINCAESANRILIAFSVFEILKKKLHQLSFSI